MGFVDANILADAILAQSRMDEITGDYVHHRNFELTSGQMDDLFKSYEPARLAYYFFLMLRAPVIPTYSVVTSNLALLEATSVIVEEFIERQLSSRRIVRRYWKSARAKVRLSDEDLLQIYSGIQIFTARLGHALIVQDEYNLDMADRLVTKFTCNARDAILVATALKNSCSQFITRDARLKRQLRGFEDIRITSIQTVVGDLGIRLGPSK